MVQFQVTSENRAAARRIVRRMLGLSGPASSALTLAELQQALETIVAQGKMSEGAIQAALVVHTVPASPPVVPVPADPFADMDDDGARHDDDPAPARKPTPAPVHVAGSLDGMLAAMVEREIQRMRAAGELGLDPEALDRMIADRVAQTTLPPTIIRIDDAAGSSRTVEGDHHYLLDHVIRIIGAGLNAWLPGPAGSGKSIMGRQAGKALGYDAEDGGAGIYMSGAIETPFQLIGFKSPNGDESTLQTPLRMAVDRGGLFIFDDTDRSSVKALAAFNEGMANGYWTFPDRVVKAHPKFRVIATANTYGKGGGGDYVGASRLDAATLNRFVFLHVPYDQNLEMRLAGAEGASWCRFVQSVRAACDMLGIKHLVTPRQTLQGIALSMAGFTRDQVEDMTVFAGLDATTVARIREQVK